MEHLALRTDQVSWTTPDGKKLFADLSLSFTDRRTGIVGRNGVGKTALLRLLAGEVAPTSGSVTRSGVVRYMRQMQPRQSDICVSDLFGASKALDLLKRALDGRASIEELADADWILEERLLANLRDVGLDVPLDTPLSSLSGGQQTRAALAACLADQPDFLLLDEPTNNLDREGRDALRSVLATISCRVIVVSHDSSLLEQMDAIVELTSSGHTLFSGNWFDYQAAKEAAMIRAEKELATAERHSMEVVLDAQRTRERQSRRQAAGRRSNEGGGLPAILAGRRRDRAEKTSGEKSRLAERLRSDAQRAVLEAQKKIDVFERAEIELSSTRLAKDKLVAEVTDAIVEFASAAVLRRFNLTVTGPERIALRGKNGSGKSTLLRLLSGQIPAQHGSVRVCVPVAYLDQQASLLDPSSSILDNFRRCNPEASANACHAALARFRFRGLQALQIVSTLSGGQTLLAAVACVIGHGSPIPFLLLDEPSNHLDLDAMDALAAGLRAYDGAFILASHDERFYESVGINRTIDLDKVE